ELAPAGDVAAIVAGTHGDPFAVLGVHEAGKGFVARCFVPNAECVTAYTLTGKEVGELIRSNDAGFFEGRLSIRKRQPLRYRAKNAGGDWWLTDPYSFGPVLGPMDDYYMAEGSHLRLFDKLGAHIIEHEGATGVHFAVWAPNVRRVSVVGTFNDWVGRRHVPHLGRTRRAADPLCGRHRLHPYRVPADFRASLRPVLGLPDDGALCADRPLRRSRRLRPLRRRRAPCRRRRHPRLGAGAFPGRRAWAGSIRRHRALR